MQLFWSSRSPYVRKVMITAHVLGLEGRITLRPTVVTQRNRNADMVAVNPLGQIPTLITDAGDVLYGSATICAYLAALVPDATLFSADPANRFAVLTREALGDGLLDALIRWYSERNRDDARAAEFMAVCRAKLLDGVAHLETAVPPDRPPDIGDIAIATALSYADFRFAEADWRAGHPLLAQWYAKIARHPAFIATEFRA